MEDKHKDLLKKLRELSMRGVDGERENAQKLFDRLSKKYGISESELDDECITVHQFTFHGAFEKQLLIQIIAKVLNANPDFYNFTSNLTGRKKRTILGAKCTETQCVEINFLFDFYNTLYQKELEYFLIAFIQKHRLFKETDENDNETSTLSYEEWLKVRMLAESMSSETPYLRIEGGAENG